MQISQGDIFYTTDGGRFQLFKLLKEEYGIWHVLVYDAVEDVSGDGELKIVVS